MGAAVAPAVGTAFGSSAVASFVAPAVLAPLSTAAFTGSFVPKLLTASTGIPAGGGFFGGLSSMFSSLNSPLGGLLGDASIMDLGFGASKIIGGIQSIRQGNIMKNQYELQNLQMLADTEARMLNYELAGMKRLDKLSRINAANMSKAYARGVDGSLGSAKFLAAINDEEYGEDYKLDLMNMQNDLVNGKVQGDIYKTAGAEAVTGSWFDAAAKLGEGAYLYKRLG